MYAFSPIHSDFLSRRRRRDHLVIRPAYVTRHGRNRKLSKGREDHDPMNLTISQSARSVHIRDWPIREIDRLVSGP